MILLTVVNLMLFVSSRYRVLFQQKRYAIYSIYQWFKGVRRGWG